MLKKSLKGIAKGAAAGAARQRRINVKVKGLKRTLGKSLRSNRVYKGRKK